MSERDPRWENVYASKRPMPTGDNHPDSFTYKFLSGYTIWRLEVDWNGQKYWLTQKVHRDDLVDMAYPNVERWLWEEMIKIIDEQMDGVR